MTAAVRTIAAFVSFLAVAAPPTGLQAQPPEQQEEFLPVEDLPPTEQIPAAPLLIGAYAFVVVVLFLYLVSVSRRLIVLQREVQRLEAEVRRSAASADGAVDKRRA